MAQTPAPSSAPTSALPIKRNRQGCLCCRRRRKKCDEQKPTCGRCRSNSEQCEWDTGIRFRVSSLSVCNPSRETRSPSLRRSGKHRRIESIASRLDGHEELSSPQSLEVVDDKHGTEASSPERDLSMTREEGDSHTNNLKHATMMPDNDSVVMSWSPTHDNMILTSFPDQRHERMPSMIHSPSRSSHRGSSTGFSGELNTTTDTLSRTTSASILSPQNSQMLIDAVGDHPITQGSVPDRYNVMQFKDKQLQTLDYLTWQPTGDASLPTQAQDQVAVDWTGWGDIDWTQAPSLSEEDALDSSDTYSLDYPNQTYKDLHMIFRHSMVERAKYTSLTRQATPVPQAPETSITGQVDHSQSNLRQTDRLREVTQPIDSDSLTPLREMSLWRNYVSEICVWLDMFDNCNHFAITIPALARSASHLRYSVLALSARQMERREASKPYTESLYLYQKAIQLILPALQTLDTAVIASCVLLCVLEMMSSSPRAWGRHLDGCAMLMQAASINGGVGGVNQALFWCFARMDLWGGFLKDSITKIPTNCWFPIKTMAMVVNEFKNASTNLDKYANYMVFLCASVVNVITTDHSDIGPGRESNENEPKSPYAARWKALFDVVEDWYSSRPPGMTPIMKAPADTKDRDHPFPIIVYGSSAGANGNQLYHAAAILLQQNKPSEFRHVKGHGSLLWHARQICGIAISNHDHGAWTNAIQPLWIAGRLMSNAVEHAAILSILAQIEQETGFATSWRGQDLKDHWGEIDA